jgi:hypothetical protein
MMTQAASKTYFAEETGGCLLITCTNLLLDDAGIPGSKDIVIKGDSIRLRGILRLPGHSVRIFARKLQVEEGTVVDVSGIDQTAVLPRAVSASAPGAHGSDGGPGAPGQDAGTIVVFAESIRGKLTLKANGGRGGSGQDGGHGAPGATGPNGRDNNTESPGNNQGSPGSPGEKGGDGGTGGLGGPGGAAGTIVVKTVLPVEPGLVTVEAVAGKGGIGGKGGREGPGGAGGLGGTGKSCHYV